MERIKSPRMDLAIRLLKAGGLTNAPHPVRKGMRVVGFSYDPTSVAWDEAELPMSAVIYMSALVEDNDGETHSTEPNP